MAGPAGPAHLWVPGEPLPEDAFHTQVADRRGQSGNAQARVPEEIWSYVKAILPYVSVPGWGNPYEHGTHGQSTTSAFLRDAIVHRAATLERRGWVETRPEKQAFDLYLLYANSQRERRERSIWDATKENWAAELADLLGAGRLDEAQEKLEGIGEDVAGLPERFREDARVWLARKLMDLRDRRGASGDVREIGGLTRGAGESTVRGARRGGRVARPAG